MHWDLDIFKFKCCDQNVFISALPVLRDQLK